MKGKAIVQIVFSQCLDKSENEEPVQNEGHQNFDHCMARSTKGKATIEPVHEKTNNLGFRPSLTQTRLYSRRKRLEA